MGNVLAIHGNSDTHWGRENENRIFEKFLNRTLQPANRKRACCLGIVGVSPSTAAEGYGVQVPIANVGIKDSNELTTGISDIDDKINEIVRIDNNKDVLKKEGVTIKRVSFYNKEKDTYCMIQEKKHEAPLTNLDTDTSTNVCDDYYREFCKEHISSCSTADKFNGTTPRCSNKNSVGEALFPNETVSGNMNAAHIYPEDCACMNSIFGRNYNTDYGIFVKSVNYINPVHADLKCNELSISKKAYPTTADRQMASKGMTICENNINIDNIQGDLTLYDVNLENNCISEEDANNITADIDKSNTSNQSGNNKQSTSLFIGIGFVICCIFMIFLMMILLV